MRAMNEPNMPFPEPEPRARALVPFFVFAAFYLGLSLWARDFYRVPIIIAFLVASAVALVLGRERPLAERVDRYARGMGETNIMLMCLIFILSGAFATVAKGSGAVDSAVALAQAAIPSKLMLAGLFVVSCLISLAIGTSCGTIAAVTPIAAGLTGPMGLSPALTIGAVVGGAMFGDNLSMISDTTIAATRTQGIGMREKFRANIGIALPAALAAVAVYCCLGGSGAASVAAPVARALVWQDAVLVLPYILILALALMGLNVMMLLFAGTALAAMIGIVCGRFTFWGALDLLGKGTLGMSETLIVAILAGGLLATIRENGGIAWFMKSTARLVRGPRSCEFAVGLLTIAVNLFTANNTVAIVVAGPVAKDFADRCKASPSRIASVLDTTSCVTQGLIPYGAQLLMAVGLAKEGGLALGSFHLIGSLYYPFFLAIAVIAAILFFRPRHVRQQ